MLNDSCQSSLGTTLKGHLDKSVIDKILSGEGYIAAARKPWKRGNEDYKKERGNQIQLFLPLLSGADDASAQV